MKIVILGAGVIGVTTAYVLAKNGHKVTLIERNSQSATECSFANGGQLSYSHVEPWANPAILPKIPSWLLDKHSPLVFRPTLDMQTWQWTLKFLLNCTTKKSDSTSRMMMPLALYSRLMTLNIVKENKMDFSFYNGGIIHIFSDKKQLTKHLIQAELQKSLGCDYEILADKTACIAKEPAFEYSPTNIECGIFFPTDASGDANKFTNGLLKLCKKMGVDIHFNCKVERIEANNHSVRSVVTDQGEFTADKYIVALGAYSGKLLKNIGVKLPIYPLKGYSLSIDINDNKLAPKCSVTDLKHKIVASNFGKVLRVAGTAEFAGFNHDIDSTRIESLKLMVKKLVPAEMGDIDNATPWACLRPSTPDGAPLLGGLKKFDNLVLNTGHGTLGWTLACGSAYAVANYIEGKEPEIDINAFNLNRYYSNS